MGKTCWNDLNSTFVNLNFCHPQEHQDINTPELTC